MAITINFSADKPGQGAKVHPRWLRARVPVTADGTFNLDSSYPTGGYPINSVFDLFQQVAGVLVAPTAGYLFDVDYTNKKLKVFHFNYPAASAGAAVEVPNGTNLSSVTDVRWFAWGV